MHREPCSLLEVYMYMNIYIELRFAGFVKFIDPPPTHSCNYFQYVEFEWPKFFEYIERDTSAHV